MQKSQLQIIHDNMTGDERKTYRRLLGLSVLGIVPGLGAMSHLPLAYTAMKAREQEAAAKKVVEGLPTKQAALPRATSPLLPPEQKVLSVSSALARRAVKKPVDEPWEISKMIRAMPKEHLTAAYAATWIPVLAVTPPPALPLVVPYAAARTWMTYAGKDKLDDHFDKKYKHIKVDEAEYFSSLPGRLLGGPAPMKKSAFFSSARKKVQAIGQSVTDLHEAAEAVRKLKQHAPKAALVGLAATGLGAATIYHMGKQEGELKALRGKVAALDAMSRSQMVGGSYGDQAALNSRPGAAQMGLANQPTASKGPVRQSFGLPKPPSTGFDPASAALRANAPVAPSMANKPGMGVQPPTALTGAPGVKTPSSLGSTPGKAGG